eukprot:tig00020537_g10289.t1
MMAHRPFPSLGALLAFAETVWNNLDRVDALESFSHHPKIGDIDALRTKFQDTKQWAEKEQAGTSQASEEVLHALASENEEYLKKFGYIFIVCATGKSAEEMLDLLQARLRNDPEKELQVARAEELKILLLRLNKLLNELGDPRRAVAAAASATGIQATAKL